MSLPGVSRPPRPARGCGMAVHHLLGRELRRAPRLGERPDAAVRGRRLVAGELRHVPVRDGHGRHAVHADALTDARRRASRRLLGRRRSAIRAPGDVAPACGRRRFVGGLVRALGGSRRVPMAVRLNARSPGDSGRFDAGAPNDRHPARHARRLPQRRKAPAPTALMRRSLAKRPATHRRSDDPTGRTVIGRNSQTGVFRLFFGMRGTR